MDLLSQTCRESEINPILLPSAKKETTANILTSPYVSRRDSPKKSMSKTLYIITATVSSFFVINRGPFGQAGFACIKSVYHKQRMDAFFRDWLL